VHDSSAKIPSGIFNGNLNQYGDFDQCLNVKSEVFQGKYCVAYLQPRSQNGSMKDLLKLVQSHEFFKSNFDDVRLIHFLDFFKNLLTDCSVLLFHSSVDTGHRAFLK
jgi:Nose resistant-to-fluoxetine protein, N-terminal domain